MRLVTSRYSNATTINLINPECNGTTNMGNTLADLDGLIVRGRKLIFVETVEEVRLLHHLEGLARTRGMCLYTWDAAEGLACVTPIDRAPRIPRFHSLSEALE